MGTTKLIIKFEDAYRIYSYCSVYIDSIEVFLHTERASNAGTGIYPSLVRIPYEIHNLGLVYTSKMIKILCYLNDSNSLLTLLKYPVRLEYTLRKHIYEMNIIMRTKDYNSYIIKSAERGTQNWT